MSITHSINIVYNGGPTPVSSSLSYAGESELNSDTICAVGPSTTTMTGVFIGNPTVGFNSCMFLASGNCTLDIKGSSGGSNTVGLVAGAPFVRYTGNLSGLPSSADTYTFKVYCGSSATVTTTYQQRINLAP